MYWSFEHFILALLFMQLFLKILTGMANSVDPDQTAPRSSLIWVCTVCISHFVRNFGVQIFRSFTYYSIYTKMWASQFDYLNCLTYADRMVNCKFLDQTASFWAVWSGSTLSEYLG